MKTKEALAALVKEIEELQKELKELTAEELEQVYGGQALAAVVEEQQKGNAEK